MQNWFELSQEFERVLNVADNFEILVYVLLEGSFYWTHVNVEFNKVTIESVVVEIKKLVILFLERVDIVLEADKNWSNILKIVLLKSLELLDGAEEFL